MAVAGLALAVLPMALTGCVGFLAGPTGDAALEAWRTEAAEVDSRLGGLEVITGTWSRGDGEGTWRAWFEGDELVTVRERLRFGDYGQRVGRLYFEDGTLRYFVAKGTEIDMADEDRQQLAQVQREIVFDHAGREIASREATAGDVGPIAPNIVIGARLHGAELQREAEGLRPQRPKGDS